MQVSGKLGVVPGQCQAGEQSPQISCRVRKNIYLLVGSGMLLPWCLCQLQLRH